MDTINRIELTETRAASHILRDRSEYATLACIAPFDVPQTHKHSAEPSVAAEASDSMTTAQAITYIALAKMCMLKPAELFLQFKDKDKIFVDGTVEAVLSVEAIPIKLIFECLSSSKVWEGPAAVEDCDDVLLEGHQEGWAADSCPLFWHDLS